jgi:hypothetical protein
MDFATAKNLMAQYFTPYLRADQQYDVTPEAAALIDQNHDNKITQDEVLAGLMKDQIAIDPKTREIIANRSLMAIDSNIMPKQHGQFGTVEQCMEFVMRYFRVARQEAGEATASFDTDFGKQHNLADTVRQLAAGTLDQPGYDGYLNGGITPPRAGDILSAENQATDEFHVALVTNVQKQGNQWYVTVYQANVPFNNDSPNLSDHLQKLPMTYQNGKWVIQPLNTSQEGYKGDMAVVGWIHPEDDKALPGAAI